MASSSSFVGGSAVIRDSSGNMIAETKIMDYDRKFMIIRVKGRLAHLRKDEVVKVLILRASNTYEFTGVVRLAQQDVADIALAKGGKKENRGATRYKLKSSARIDRIFANTVLLNLPVPAEVTITNISATGLCFESTRTFRVDGKLEIKMKIGDNDVAKTIRVVRMTAKEVPAPKVLDEEEAEEAKKEIEYEYGCQFK